MLAFKVQLDKGKSFFHLPNNTSRKDTSRYKKQSVFCFICVCWFLSNIEFIAHRCVLTISQEPRWGSTLFFVIHLLIRFSVLRLNLNLSLFLFEILRFPSCTPLSPLQQRRKRKAVVKLPSLRRLERRRPSLRRAGFPTRDLIYFRRVCSRITSRSTADRGFSATTKTSFLIYALPNTNNNIIWVTPDLSSVQLLLFSKITSIVWECKFTFCNVFNSEN
jgi:hypothetical protein